MANEKELSEEDKVAKVQQLMKETDINDPIFEFIETQIDLVNKLEQRLTDEN